MGCWDGMGSLRRRLIPPSPRPEQIWDSRGNPTVEGESCLHLPRSLRTAC